MNHKINSLQKGKKPKGSINYIFRHATIILFTLLLACNKSNFMPVTLEMDARNNQANQVNLWEEAEKLCFNENPIGSDDCYNTHFMEASVPNLKFSHYYKEAIASGDLTRDQAKELRKVFPWGLGVELPEGYYEDQALYQSLLKYAGWVVDGAVGLALKKIPSNTNWQKIGGLAAGRGASELSNFLSKLGADVSYQKLRKQIQKNLVIASITAQKGELFEISVEMQQFAIDQVFKQVQDNWKYLSADEKQDFALSATLTLWSCIKDLQKDITLLEEWRQHESQQISNADLHEIAQNNRQAISEMKTRAANMESEINSEMGAILIKISEKASSISDIEVASRNQSSSQRIQSIAAASQNLESILESNRGEAQGLAILMSFINADHAMRFTQAYDGMFQISKGLAGLLNPASIGFFTHLGAIATGVQLVQSALNAAQPSFEQQMMSALQAISKQIANLTRLTAENFKVVNLKLDHLQEQLSEIHQDMIKNFAKIHQNQAALRYFVEQSSLEISAEQKRQNAALAGLYLVDAVYERGAILSHFSTHSLPMDLNHVKNQLINMKVTATDIAREPSLTGYGRSFPSETDLAITSFHRAVKDGASPFDYYIGSFSEFSRSYGKKSPDKSEDLLANPGVWIDVMKTVNYLTLSHQPFYDGEGFYKDIYEKYIFGYHNFGIYADLIQPGFDLQNYLFSIQHHDLMYQRLTDKWLTGMNDLHKNLSEYLATSLKGFESGPSSSVWSESLRNNQSLKNLYNKYKAAYADQRDSHKLLSWNKWVDLASKVFLRTNSNGWLKGKEFPTNIVPRGKGLTVDPDKILGYSPRSYPIVDLPDFLKDKPLFGMDFLIAQALGLGRIEAEYWSKIPTKKSEVKINVWQEKCYRGYCRERESSEYAKKLYTHFKFVFVENDGNRIPVADATLYRTIPRVWKGWKDIHNLNFEFHQKNMEYRTYDYNDEDREEETFTTYYLVHGLESWSKSQAPESLIKKWKEVDEQWRTNCLNQLENILDIINPLVIANPKLRSLRFNVDRILETQRQILTMVTMAYPESIESDQGISRSLNSFRERLPNRQILKAEIIELCKGIMEETQAWSYSSVYLENKFYRNIWQSRSFNPDRGTFLQNDLLARSYALSTVNEAIDQWLHEVKSSEESDHPQIYRHIQESLMSLSLRKHLGMEVEPRIYRMTQSLASYLRVEPLELPELHINYASVKFLPAAISFAFKSLEVANPNAWPYGLKVTGDENRGLFIEIDYNDYSNNEAADHTYSLSCQKACMVNAIRSSGELNNQVSEAGAALAVAIQAAKKVETGDDMTVESFTMTMDEEILFTFKPKGSSAEISKCNIWDSYDEFCTILALP